MQPSAEQLHQAGLLGSVWRGGRVRGVAYGGR